MLNFQPKKPVKGVGFTLDPVKREQAKAPASRRRYLHLIFLIGIIIVTGSLLLSFMEKLSNALAPVTDKLKQELPLPAMVEPTIADLPALPDANAIAEHRTELTAQGAAAAVPLWIEQPDAPTLAWIAAMLERDRSAPPLPQRVESRDLILRHIRVGENLVITGLLKDSQPAPIAGAATGYQRLLVELPEQQYLEVLAPEAARELLIGDQVVVVGRYLGFAVLRPAEQPAAPAPAAPAPADKSAAPVPAADAKAAPTADGKVVEAATPAPVTRVEVPLIAARIATKPATQREVDNPYVLRGEWKLPEDIYQNVDDDLLVVETRPYYYTLGQVSLDRTSGGYEGAKSANELGSAIHKDPKQYRGQPFTIRGRVFHAWEDPGVAQDQPFGVSRVVRLILWSEDWGDWEINEGGKIVTKRKLILRAFEVAAITHQPLPTTGELITTTGRFLRLRTMEVKANAERDRRLGIKRQSDHAHTFLFVANDFTVVPNAPTYDFSWLGILVVVVSVVVGGLLLHIARRESAKKEQIYDSVRKLRESRKALKTKAATAPVTTAEPTAPTTTDPPTPSQPPTV